MTGPRPEYESLADSVRKLIDLTIRTEADSAVALAAKAQIDTAADLLSQATMPGSFGMRQSDDGQGLVAGNVVIGLRNPVAPPLLMHHEPDGTVWSEFTLGAAYEGPPGHVHGGICALVLDHVLGATAHQPDRPAYTGTLTLRYRRGTPLGTLRAWARVDRIVGRKTFVAGTLADSSGITVDAEGVFIFRK